MFIDVHAKHDQCSKFYNQRVVLMIIPLVLGLWPHDFRYCPYIGPNLHVLKCRSVADTVIVAKYLWWYNTFCI